MAGGVQQVVIGLASELSKLSSDQEQYCFLTYRDCQEWLRPYLDQRCQILSGPPAPPLYTPSPARAFLRRWFPWARDLWQKTRLRGGIKPPVPVSDGTIERAEIDVMHFTIQSGFLTDIPSIYQPHDLQHLHLPGLFAPRDFAYRECLYRAFCQQASIVAVMTEWGKRDLLAHYPIAASKVKVIPWAPIIPAYPAVGDAEKAGMRARYALPNEFIFYPAQTWPHKNHIRLLAALALLRKEGLKVGLVCSGHLYEYFPAIERKIKQLRLQDQVRFVGFVKEQELRALFEMARLLVFPSKFEGWGLPLLEAFYLGVPVVCSNVTSLPDLVGDAALLFNPDRPEAIAAAVRRVWVEEDLRATLVSRGRRIAAQFSWARTAKMFRACYRLLAKTELTAEDLELLDLERPAEARTADVKGRGSGSLG